MPTRKAVPKSRIFEIFKKGMKEPSEIIEEAFESLGGELNDPEHIKGRFSALVLQLESSAHRLYREHETGAGSDAVMEFFGLEGEAIPLPIKIRESVRNSFDDLNKFFLSLSQSRKSKAGSAFEIIINRLFRSLQYPFDSQIVINGKPDFLLPGEKHFRVHPADCIIFTAKRTLRERWRQIVTEGIRGLGFYLASIDEKVSENGLKEMNHNRIYLVIPETLKDQIHHYKAAPNVLSFETFFRHHLDPAMQRWKDNGVIRS